MRATTLLLKHSLSHRPSNPAFQVISVWVVQNELQLNDDKKKEEILLTGSVPGIDLPSSLCVGQSDIPFSSAARNIGVIFDSQLALKEQVSKLSTLLAWRSGGRVQFDRSHRNFRFLACSL